MSTIRSSTAATNSLASSLGIDEETRVLILKKTWCHGQLMLPVFSVIYLYLFFTSWRYHVVLLFAALVLPIWSYLSYQAVSASSSIAAAENNPSPGLFWTLALLVEMAHLSIFWVAMGMEERTSITMLLMIASGLFFIETLAFLMVVRTLGNRRQDSDVYNATSRLV
ncbi:expressed unknown protein [Seminavis robusta]|uniref:Uncharacterized protein n=1 Tax=Seminavis robusta TaxID=568900 RepID=A0A9N8D4V2_9STRA|nr:expressed unknown protein [Seminavis robusta]|eukprot:Sro5_g003920.1 n/a (167) ;mRNA; f:4040-4540